MNKVDVCTGKEREEGERVTECQSGYFSTLKTDVIFRRSACGPLEPESPLILNAKWSQFPDTPSRIHQQPGMVGIMQHFRSSKQSTRRWQLKKPSVGLSLCKYQGRPLHALQARPALTFFVTAHHSSFNIHMKNRTKLF